MTAISNTATTLTTKGIREDLEDPINRVSPSKTPFISNIGSGSKATAVFHEWQTEALDTPASTNYHLEGDDLGTTYGAENVTTRVGNYCQIFVKSGLTSRTDDIVNKAGRSSEYARQVAIKGLSMKTDMEMTFLSNVASVAESGATPRKSGGIQTWISTNVSLGAGGSATGYSGGVTTAVTMGTGRTFTEALVKSVRATAFSNGATPNQAYMNGPHKQLFSAFTGIASIRKDVPGDEMATIVAAADIYVDDFGSVALFPHAYGLPLVSSVGVCLFIDPDMVAIATLDGMKTSEMAKTGDAKKFMITAEKTLVCKNQKAHAAIFGLS